MTTTDPVGPIATGTAFGPDLDADAAAVIARYPQPRSALLPLLHLAQSVEGCVSQDGISWCATTLGLTTAEVTAVATFYTMYKRTPCGQHLISVCTNTLCAMLGGDNIYAALAEELGADGAPLPHEQTVGEPGTPGSLTLEHAECLAACDLAPVLQVDYEFYDKQTTSGALELVRELRAGRAPTPTRGAPLSDFRDVSRQLAGFHDRVADVEGPSTSAETTRGAADAEQQGWAAPAMPEQQPPQTEQQEASS